MPTDDPAADRSASDAPAALGPWNPGIESPVPRRLLPRSTIFRPEHVFTPLEHAEEMHRLTGLPLCDLVAFRPERLVLHEVLIRVTGDVSVNDGERIEDLGINFRRMTATLLARYVEPQMAAVSAAYEAVRRDLRTTIEAELAAAFAPDVAPGSREPARRRFGLFRRAPADARAAPGESDADRERRALREWEAQAHGRDDSLRRAACRALARVVGALLARQSRIWGPRELIAATATDVACNEHGGEAIGRLIEPWLVAGAQREGFALLPPQAHPLVMNTKGASASGKSTMRPLQHALADTIGVHWRDFALISPDIWRKQLLDYTSLGPDHMYAGAFTGEELRIVDQKLDRHMARKAQRGGGMPHLLIDRFRFDSFAPDSDEEGSNLLTRFGHVLYLFFMITPPEATVERAWARGLEFGRYKALDDLLAHNVEAYSGMPELFFTWAKRADKQVHQEFLDNGVRLGGRPRTVAFGWNGELNVLDVKCLLDVDRYRKIDVNARSPQGLFPDREIVAPERNTQFLVQCARRLATLSFAQQDTGRIYLRLVAGKPVWVDRDALRAATADPDTRAGVLAVAPDALSDAVPAGERPAYLDELPGADRLHTLGEWGTQRRSTVAPARSRPA